MLIRTGSAAATIWVLMAALPAMAGGARPAHVSVKTPAPVTLEPGASAQASLRLDIAGGFHLQANPASDRFLIPTEVKFDPADGIVPGKLVYPQGKPHRLAGADSDISTYEGSIEVVVTVRAEPTATAGDVELHGTLRYQACDEKRCFPPASMPVRLLVRVVTP